MPGYVNFTEKYRNIQLQVWLTGTKIKYVLRRLDTHSFRDERDKIKALIIELSVGENDAATFKAFNGNTRFPENVVYFKMSDAPYLEILGLLHHALEYRPQLEAPKEDRIAIALEEREFQKTLKQYTDALFRFKQAFYAGFGSCGREKFEMFYQLEWN